ncbi:MAG TPA: LuxR C-terminal-related transcriptional regulator [Kofleriaceae bacterium]|nr:LuxR C-terminal-related transcriptional regulator [Kofleriaceae bacterium]
MEDTRVPVLAQRLREARSFIELGKLACQLFVRLGVEDCAVTLHASNGRPILTVDNTRDRDAEERHSLFARAWSRDGAMRELQQRHIPVELGAESLRMLVLPLLAPDHLVGSIRLRHRTTIGAQLRAELTALAAHVSVRLAQLGITAPADSTPATPLTPRQLVVAVHAARGRTNGEIATALALSVNTVKKHLKDVFERLAITSRIELALLMSRGALDEVLPSGVIEVDGVSVVRAIPV